MLRRLNHNLVSSVIIAIFVAQLKTTNIMGSYRRAKKRTACVPLKKRCPLALEVSMTV